MSTRITATPVAECPVSPLRRRTVEDMTIRNLSPAAQRSYLHAVEKFNQHFGRSLARLGLEDVHAYQVHLASKGVAWATLNQIAGALRFLYDVTLCRDEVLERIVYPLRPSARKIRSSLYNA